MPPSAPIVRTSCGPVRGISTPANVTQFRSIPYAAPPIGKLRWQPPVPLLPNFGCWHGTLNATTFQPACLQQARYGAPSSSSEDCLYLHVSMPPSTTSTAKPTFVWLHGGGLLEGSAFAIQSGFEAVLTHLPIALDAIVVGIEYRLGVAGWLALDALAERDRRGGGRMGNYGLLDVVEALRWVQANVGAFGGDPRRVTVCGQSSGGSLVLALLASPASRGLLHRAISLSGSPRLNSTTREASEYWHRQVVARTRCHRHAGGSALAACLLDLNTSELLAARPPSWHPDCFGLGVFDVSYQYAPLILVDGAGGLLPQPYVDGSGEPPSAVRNRRIPLLLGTTAEEGDFAPTDDVRAYSRERLRGFVADRLRRTLDGTLVRKLVDYYLGEDAPGRVAAHFEPQRVYSEIVADATVVCPNFYLAQSWQAGRHASPSSERNTPVYAYRASQPLSAPFCVLRDERFSPPYCPSYAFHASDMFAWIRPRRTPAFNFTFSPADERYGALINERFAALVHHGTVSDWAAATSQAQPMKDALPADWSAVELRVPDAPSVRGDKSEACAMWLGGGLYERIGLVN